MKKIDLLKKSILWSLLILISNKTLAQGNYVFSGSELTNFSTVNLAIPGDQTWSTDRTATPGYFSAVGTAVYTNPSDIKANVNGYVKHYATAADQGFSFPVGTGSDYRNITVSGLRPATSVIATAWILGDPTNTSDPTAPNAGTHAVTALGSGITAVSTVGQWDWQDVSENAAGVTVTVSIPDLSSFGAASDLRLVGWNGTQWVTLGTSGASANTENSTLSGTMIAGISAIGVGKIVSGNPDLTPTVQANNLVFTGISGSQDFVVNIFEIAGFTANNPITFNIRKNTAQFTITYLTTSGNSNVLGGIANSNSDWTITETGTFITVTAKSGISIPANGSKQIGFNITPSPGASFPITFPLSVTIFGNSGGETVTSNNRSITNFTIN